MNSIENLRVLTTNSFMGSEPPKYLVIHEFFLQNFVYFIFFAWSKVGLVQKILKRLGKVAWFQYKTVPQKKVFQRKIKTKISLKRESPNILVVWTPWMSYWSFISIWQLFTIWEAETPHCPKIGICQNLKPFPNCVLKWVLRGHFLGIKMPKWN